MDTCSSPGLIGFSPLGINFTLMNVKSIALFTGKVFLLTILLVFFFILGAFLSGLSEPAAGAEPTPSEAGSMMGALLISSLLQAIILSIIILRSREAGWKLTGAVFLAFYGSMAVIPQVESVVYLQSQLPPGMVPKILVMGAIVAALFSLSGVFILGKMRRGRAVETAKGRSAISISEWGWKLMLIVIAYLILYYTFGYYVAWKNPAVQTYYGGSDPGSFLAQLSDIWVSTPWMFPFQALRALLWVLLVLPIIRMLKGKPWEIGLLMALFFAVWSTQLWMPNPYMPAEVARIHFVETVSSNFIFGGLVGWLLSRRYPISGKR